MIFATVGTQLPFDRLLSALDQWATRNSDVEVLAQCGRSDRSFPHLTCRESLDQSEFARAFEKARVVVAHAGMGTILSASQMGKPILLMPRRAELGEHRNDHQLDTAAEMAALPNVTVVHDADDLAAALDRVLHAPEELNAGSAVASAELIGNLNRFIFDKPAKDNL